MILVAVLLLTCILPRTSVSASGIAGGEAEAYEKLYYFSDYVGSESFCNNVVTPILIDYGLSAADIEFHYWTNTVPSQSNDFWHKFKEYMNGNLSEIQNAFVIFEMRDNLQKALARNRSGIQTLYLKDTFETLKNQNCKILFLNTTDVCRFSGSEEYSDFLESVDIYVSADLMINFVYSLLMQMNDNYGGLHTILLKQDMSYLIAEYLIPYFRYVYNLSAMERAFHSEAAVLQTVGVDVLIQTGNDEFTDYVTGTSYDFEYLAEYRSNELCAIGNILQDVSVNLIGAGGEAWLFLMKNYRQSYVLEFPIFVYNYALDLSSYADEQNLFILNDQLYLSESFLAQIVEAFIMGRDLSMYNNVMGVALLRVSR